MAKTVRKTSKWLKKLSFWNSYSDNKFNVRFMMNLVHDKAFINNEWIEGKQRKTFDVINPASGNVFGVVPDLEEDDVIPAIKAAHAAFSQWSEMTAVERGNILHKIKEELENNISDVAKIITIETGKPIAESMTEVRFSESFLEWFSEQGKRVNGEIYESSIKNRMMMSIKQPLGVVALMTPWNFPLSMILRKATAALAAGCTCVIKPSEVSPLTALAFADITKRCELPKGVLNVVTSDIKNTPSVVKLICESPLVAGLSFTGSTEVGKILYRQCSSTIKRIALELGGNASFIVFKSANIKNAVDGGVTSKFRNCGQTCISANRFFIHDKVYSEFVEQMKNKINSLKIGNGLVPGVKIGPLTTLKQVEKMEMLVKDAVSKGAKILAGGERMTKNGQYFYQPTLLGDIKENMLCFTEEIFGPIVPCIKFNNEDEVIKISNDTRKGLAGYFYSDDLSQVFRVAKKMEVGMVGVNDGAISSVEAPFGGVKESGIGREASHHGIEEFVNIKYICIGHLSQK